MAVVKSKNVDRGINQDEIVTNKKDKNNEGIPIKKCKKKCLS